MNSILALAAACKCNDLMEPPELRSQNWSSMVQLLFAADRHHRESLQQIQDIIASPEHYDQVLGNAALMVLYGYANHWIRIRMAESTASSNGSQIKLVHDCDLSFLVRLIARLLKHSRRVKSARILVNEDKTL